MRYILSTIAALSLLGCSGFLKEYSQDLVIPDNIEDLKETILGSGYIQSWEIENYSGKGLEFFINVLDDDINTIIAANATTDGIYGMNWKYYGYTAWQLEVGRTYDASHLSDDNLYWDDLYKRANVMNILIDEATKMQPTLEEEIADKETLLGECYFLRALNYFYLVNIYADAYAPSTASEKPGVPLKTSPYVENIKFDRAPISEVYDQIVTDLTLSIEHFSKGTGHLETYRASGNAALLLLSRVYLYMQEWEKARDTSLELLKVKDNLVNMSVIAMDETRVMLDGTTPELIFSQGPLNLQQDYAGGGGSFCLTRELYEIYSEEDYRRKIYFNEVMSREEAEQLGVALDSVTLNRKFRIDEPHESRVSDVYTLRSAEAYLNGAEGAALMGDETKANELLNAIKTSRIEGYVPATLSGDALIDEIRAERRREFVLEGHRWFDLRRYAVCTKRPSSKKISHTFVLYDVANYNEFVSYEIYELEANDPAYTFAIPLKVITFNSDMEINEREKREYVFSEDKLPTLDKPANP